MPTVLIIFGIRFFFYSREHLPIHVHIETGDGTAKFEVETEVRLVENKGVKTKDIRLSESILEENRENFVNEWNNFFGSSNL